MAHHASVTGDAGDSRDGDEGPRVSVRARELPPQVVEARDQLFGDADRHGPRWQVLVRRGLPAALGVPIAIALAAWQPWRELVIDAVTPATADLVLVAPVLIVAVLLAAALAALARVRAEPVLAGGLALLGASTLLVQQGSLVAAAVPATFGAALVGITAARAIRRAVWALPLLLAAGISDAHSVAAGVTNRLLADGATTGAGVERIQPTLSVAPSMVERVDLLVLHVPAATGTWMLGLVDVLALGMLLGLAHLFWLPIARTAAALAIALGIAVASGSVVPVLPLLGIAWLLIHARLVWRSTRFSLRRLTYLGG